MARRAPEIAILVYPRLLRLLFPRATSVSRAIYPFIFLTPDIYSRVRTHGEEDGDAWAVVIHERAHLSRVHMTTPIVGPLVFGFRFLVADKRFTLEEELYAIRAEMQYRKSRGITYDIERKARQFSSPLYRNLTTYEEGKRILTELWTNA